MKIYENGTNWLIEDQLNEELVEKITNFIDENLNSLLKQKEGYSTTGKNAEQYWIIKSDSNFYFTTKKFEEIKKEYTNQVLGRLKKSELINEKVKDNLKIDNKNCWTVVGEENSYHAIHYHNDANYDGISTILYLKIPETNIEQNPENDIFLIMNSGENNHYYYNKPKILTINPEVGKLLIFPDWIIHGTYPQTKGIRQSFNIDYNLIFKETKPSLLKYD